MKTLKIFKKEYRRIGYDVSDIEAQEYMEVCATYNADGKITREEHYNPDGTVNTLTVNTYNNQNLLMQSEQFDKDHVLIQKSVNIYDEKLLLKQQSNFFGEDSAEYVTKFYYDDQHNPIRQEIFLNGKLDYVEKIFEYRDGRLAKETDNDDYGKPQYIHHYQYNNKGLVIQYVRDEVQENDRRTFEYAYDEHDNRTKELVYDYDNALIAKTYHAFNDKNQLIQTEEEDLDNYRRIELEYEGDRVIKNTLFNKENKITGWAEYTYNEDNKETSSKEFIMDEVNPDSYRLIRETRYERLD